MKNVFLLHQWIQSKHILIDLTDLTQDYFVVVLGSGC